MESRGVLIAFEGIDGCGKSTQVRRLAEALRQRGHQVSVFREPGDSAYGRELRRIFVDGRDVEPAEEVRLFLEDRRIDVRDNVEPALRRGDIVLMDRYYLSSVVYQGELGVDPASILAANLEFAPPPHLTIILDIDPGVAAERIHAARGGINSFEQRDYQERVRAAYLQWVDGETICSVDAGGDADAVHEALLRVVVQAIESGRTAER